MKKKLLIIGAALLAVIVGIAVKATVDYARYGYRSCHFETYQRETYSPSAALSNTDGQWKFNNRKHKEHNVTYIIEQFDQAEDGFTIRIRAKAGFCTPMCGAYFGFTDESIANVSPDTCRVALEYNMDQLIPIEVTAYDNSKWGNRVIEGKFTCVPDEMTFPVLYLNIRGYEYLSYWKLGMLFK